MVGGGEDASAGAVGVAGAVSRSAGVGAASVGVSAGPESCSAGVAPEEPPSNFEQCVMQSRQIYGTMCD